MKLEAKLDGNNVVISKDSFMHMLNCMGEQKYLPIPGYQFGSQLETQKVISKAWRDGMNLLHYRIKSNLVNGDTFNNSLLNRKTFEQELVSLINRYSKENDSDTPDFILSQFILETLETFNRSVRMRSEWYSKSMENNDDSTSTLTYPANIKFTVKYHAE